MEIEIGNEGNGGRVREMGMGRWVGDDIFAAEIAKNTERRWPQPKNSNHEWTRMNVEQQSRNQRRNCPQMSPMTQMEEKK